MLVALTRVTAGLFGRGGVGGLATPVMGTEGAEPALEECQVGGEIPFKVAGETGGDERFAFGHGDLEPPVRTPRADVKKAAVCRRAMLRKEPPRDS